MTSAFSTTATLFLTHFINQEVLDRFQRLHESCEETYHVFFALNDEIGYDLACMHGYRIFTFTFATGKVVDRYKMSHLK